MVHSSWAANIKYFDRVKMEVSEDFVMKWNYTKFNSFRVVLLSITFSLHFMQGYSNSTPSELFLVSLHSSKF
ncbi:MAG: hypothetical protein ACOYMA_14500 [Bacteroidia bacterium]